MKIGRIMYSEKSLKCQILKDEKSFLAIKDEWIHLQSKTENNSFFLQWDWMFYWWQSFSKENKLSRLFIIIVKEDEGQIRLIAPFYIDQIKFFGLKYKVIRFLGSLRESKDLDIIADQKYKNDSIDCLLECLRRESDEYNFGLLTCLLPNSFLTPSILEKFENNKFLYNLKEGLYSEINLKVSWDDYLLGLQPRMRTKIRKMLREYKNSSLRLSISDKSTIINDFEKFVYLHQSRWEKEKEPGAFGGGKQYRIDFFKKIVESFCEQKKIFLYTLYDSNNEVLGSHLYFVNKDRIYLFQEAYKWSNDLKSPGNMLRAVILNKLSQKNKYIYDFMTGWSFHKESWGAIQKVQYYFRFGNNSFKTKFYFLTFKVHDSIFGKINSLIKIIKK